MVHAGWWWPSSAAALLLVLLCCTVSCASTLDLAIISSNNNDALPRRPAPVVRHADDRRGADSDGITRTPGSNCHSSDGVTCDLCCNGICCEDFSGTSSDSIPTSHRVGLRFNVISADNATYASIMTPTADGRFPSRVHQNVATLNRVFNPILNVWFYVEAIVPWTDPRMVASCNTDPCYQSVACDFYTYTLPTVRRDSSKVINVVVADQIGYLGESQWPWASVEDSPYQYVEVHAKTVGVSAPGWPTGLGYTLVHEMGHYFGLLHVFERQGHCDVVNDWVDDTPTSLNPANREQDCNTPVDSCPSLPGNDDINNFMNYARDECMTEGFTRGQQARLRQGARRYRPLLMAATAVSDGITCSVNATTLCECVPSSCGGTLVPSSPPTTTPPSSASTPPTTATPTSTSTTPASTVMPNATTTMGGSSNSSDSIIGGVVGAAIIVIVISGICVCARARRQRVLAAGYAPPLPTPTKLTADKLRTFDTLPPPVLSSTTMVSEDSDAHFQVQVDDNRPLTTTNGSPHAAKAPSRTAVVVELIPSTTPTSTRVGPLAQTEWSDDEKAVSPTLQLQTSVTVTGKAPSSDVNTGLQRFAGFQRRDEEPAHRADGEVATTSGGDRRDGASSLNSSSLHTATSVARTARQHSRVASATSDVLRTPRSHAETDEIGPASVNLSFGE